MMNIVALCLVLTTLATAGVWSPTPNPERVQIKQDLIVKEGHRTVEIEYGQDDGNTKVKISPQEGQTHVDSASVSSTLKDKVSEGVGNVKEKFEEEIGHKGRSRELVCDAFGKCKHKIASAVGKTKEVFSEKAHGAKDKVEEVEGEAKHAVEETVGRMKDAVTRKAHEAVDKARETKEKVRRATKEATDIGKTLREDVKKNASEELTGTESTVHEAEEKMEHKKKYLQEILRRGGEFVDDIFGYVLSPKLRASGVGIMQLLGLSVAYGMSTWVTFISSYIMAGVLPRQQFAILQSKIYPVYFRAMAYSVGMVLVSHCLRPRKGGKAEMFQGLNLFASLLMLLFNLRYLEPRATKVMFERMKLEKEEGRGMGSPTTEPSVMEVNSINEPSVERSATAKTTAAPQEKPEADAAAAAKSEMVRLSEALKRLNSYSSFLNILTLMALTWHLVHLGQVLHTNTE